MAALTMRESEAKLQQAHDLLCEVYEAMNHSRPGVFEVDVVVACIATRLAKGKLGDRIAGQLADEADDKDLARC
jgi:hypothetical protein